MKKIYITDWGFNAKDDKIILHLSNGSRLEVAPTDKLFNDLENCFK